MLNIAIEEKQPVILLFGAEWSGNTSIMNSMMERISQEIDAKIKYYKVDIEKQKDISKSFGINTVPTTVMLKDGEVAELVKGFLPARRIRDMIRNIYFSD